MVIPGCAGLRPLCERTADRRLRTRPRSGRLSRGVCTGHQRRPVLRARSERHRHQLAEPRGRGRGRATWGATSPCTWWTEGPPSRTTMSPATTCASCAPPTAPAWARGHGEHLWSSIPTRASVSTSARGRRAGPSRAGLLRRRQPGPALHQGTGQYRHHLGHLGHGGLHRPLRCLLQPGHRERSPGDRVLPRAGQRALRARQRRLGHKLGASVGMDNSQSGEAKALHWR